MINMKIIRKYKYLLTIIIFIIIFIGLFLIKNRLNNNKYNVVNKEDDILIEKVKKDDKINENEECNVDIKGAIKNPGVYTVDCDNKVSDVINIAGGLKENADTSLMIPNFRSSEYTFQLLSQVSGRSGRSDKKGVRHRFLCGKSRQYQRYSCTCRIFYG